MNFSVETVLFSSFVFGIPLFLIIVYGLFKKMEEKETSQRDVLYWRGYYLIMAGCLLGLADVSGIFEIDWTIPWEPSRMVVLTLFGLGLYFYEKSYRLRKMGRTGEKDEFTDYFFEGLYIASRCLLGWVIVFVLIGLK